MRGRPSFTIPGVCAMSAANLLIGIAATIALGGPLVFALALGVVAKRADRRRADIFAELEREKRRADRELR